MSRRKPDDADGLWGIDLIVALIVAPLVSALAVVALRWSDYLGLPLAQQRPAFILYPAFAGFLAGLLVDVNVFMLKSNQARLRALTTRMTDIAKNVADAQEEIKAVATRTGNLLGAYQHIRDLLASNKFNGEFARIMLGYAIEHFWRIADSNREQYCRYLEQGIKWCRTWEGIHQGSVREFIEPETTIDATYLDQLNKSERVKVKRRIIILTKEQEYNDIKNWDVMKRFWNCTGKEVTSYYIIDSAAFNLARFSGPLHDCALHDGSLLLHYNKNEHRIEFAVEGSYDEGGRVSAVKALFAALDLDSTKHNFVKITERTGMP